MGAVSKHDYSQLLWKMKQSGETQSSLSKSVGISLNSLNLALNNHRAFRQVEICKICDHFDIPASEIGTYFFKH